MTARAHSQRPAPNLAATRRFVGANGWTIGVYVLLALMFAFTFAINSRFGDYDLRSLALGTMPAAFAAVAEAIVVLAAGIDLSVGSLIAVANVLAATLMFHAGFGQSLVMALVVLALLTLAGALNGTLIVVTKVPDIVVTLAMSFVWSGVALFIMSQPGGGAPRDLLLLGTGWFLIPWLPNALLIVLVVTAVVWVPIRNRSVGLSIYATGSDPQAAMRSGVNVTRARVIAYGLSGFFCGAAGLALTMSTGSGDPLSGTFFTLTAVATIVLGGVSLAGGRGGLLGPLAAAFVLSLISSDLIVLGVSPSYGQVIQGTVMVFVVMAGGLVALRRSSK